MASTKARSMGARIALVARIASSTIKMAAKATTVSTSGGIVVLVFI
ncbi:MAG: hypothetical protein ACK2T3_00820 [Candidatus Promineifilaceae bacterium]